MSLNDPIKVYFAANNMEAKLLCEMLKNSGIEASSVEDHSQMGTWIGGLAYNLHKPQVWVNRVDEARAKELVAAFEQRASSRRNATSDDGTITVTCEECGTTQSFPAFQVGSVQSCTRCDAFVDVGDDAWEGWEGDSDEPAAEADSGSDSHSPDED